jgi:hypothetical protein
MSRADREPPARSADTLAQCVAVRHADGVVTYDLDAIEPSQLLDVVHDALAHGAGWTDPERRGDERLRARR